METENTDTGEGASWPGWQEANAALEVFQAVVDKVLESLSDRKGAEPVCDWIDSELTPMLEDYQELLFNAEDSLTDALEAVKTLTEEAEFFAETMRRLDEIQDEMEGLGEQGDKEVRIPNSKVIKGGKAFNWDEEEGDVDEIELEASPTDDAERIAKEMARLKKAGWHFYHVMLQSV